MKRGLLPLASQRVRRKSDITAHFLARRCHLWLRKIRFALASPPVCLFLPRRIQGRLTSLLPLCRPASCPSMQDCPRRLVNTGNTKPLTTSLLCLEDCHDNTQWITRRAGVFVSWIHTEICPSSALLCEGVQLWLMCCLSHHQNKEPFTAGTQKSV